MSNDTAPLLRPYDNINFPFPVASNIKVNVFVFVSFVFIQVTADTQEVTQSIFRLFDTVDTLDIFDTACRKTIYKWSTGLLPFYAISGYVNISAESNTPIYECICVACVHEFELFKHII